MINSKNFKDRGGEIIDAIKSAKHCYLLVDFFSAIMAKNRIIHMFLSRNQRSLFSDLIWASAPPECSQPGSQSANSSNKQNRHK